MPVTTAGGVLVRGNNGHINRGGEFEKRAAFIRQYELPNGTVGLAAGRSGLYVFGHTTTPVGIPVGVTYQRLQHPSGSALDKVLSYDLYAGSIYAVGQFADGSIYHFYNGTRVTDWYDGRARASFEVTGGGVTAAVAASGSFEVTGGTLGGGNQVTDITIDGVSIISAPVAHTGNNSTTAAAVASAINSYTSSPDYSAAANGQTVTITAVTAGTTPNGKAIVVTVGGTATVGNATTMSGGAASVTSQLTNLTVAGVAIIGSAVTWATSNENTAALIAAAINSHTSSPDYTATSVGTQVNIIASTAGTSANGRAVAFTRANGLTVDPSSSLTLAGGSDSSAFTPGTFVKTIGSRVHSVSGPIEHFSGIGEPTKWTTDTTGAGFIDMSTQASGSETLTALEQYQRYVAVFAEDAIQIWFFDSDPALHQQQQVLNNTGTSCPRSVTQFGDNDLFYVDESGLRSLRARDSSNAAATTDIGVPIDTLVTEALRGLDSAERQDVIGLIEPGEGRFWLCMLDRIFVFSFFGGAKISAWTTYTPEATVEGDRVEFDIEDVAVYNRRVYIRSGNDIFVYGGTGANPEYDETEAEAWLPYLDADTPTKKKQVTGIDAAVEGAWEVSLAMNPNDEDAADVVATVFRTTYNDLNIAAVGEATHFSLRFRSTGSTAARLSAAIIHYDGGGDED